jgi:outer membrane receptor protein involved in Fe transport
MKTQIHPFVRVLLLGALFLGTLTLARAAAEARQAYDLPGGNAADTLKQFAAVSGRETLFAAEIVRGVTTQPVKGAFTPQEALDRMLAGTGLVATSDAKTGAFAVRKGAADPNAPRAASAAREIDRASLVPKIDETPTQLEAFEVTGSRLRLNSGEQPMQPVLTFTSTDIERTGAVDLGQLFQYIPAVTSFNTGLGTDMVNSSIASGMGTGQTQSRTTAQLRGGTEASTLLLVDGKRVPLTGVRNIGGNGYDLGGIPLSAIERVEVLLDGASAVYGADAIHGVINVILKKRYSGTEVKLGYDNTFDKDAGIKTASLTHGFAKGKWSGMLTLSGSMNNIMLLTDRYLTRSYNRTLYGGITDQSQPTLFVEGTGSLNVAAGNLPGTTTPRVSIPAGSDGTGLTVAQYLAAPPPVGGITPGRYSGTSYTRDRSGMFRLSYDFSERLQFSAQVRMGRKNFHDNGQWRSVQNVTIPTGYAGNPFGVPVRLSKIFYDLPPIVAGSKTANDEISLTASGKLPRDWRYQASVSYVRGDNFMITPNLPGAGGLIGTTTAPAAQFTTKLNAAIAAGRAPVLIYDSNTRSPNAPGALDEFWVSTSQTRLNDRVQTWTYSAQADGKVVTLPAGDLKTVIGAERREEYVSFPGNVVGGQVWPRAPQRNVNAFFAEARLPVFAAKQKLPLLHQVDLTAAVRAEDYSDFGRATKPRYGIGWRPFKPLLLRGSYGEGFMAPPRSRTNEQNATITLPASTIAILYAGQVDLSRGNAPIVGPLDQLSGGNPNLKPQLSKNVTYGLVLDVPQVKGLALSFDYYDYKFTRAFGSISSMMDRQLFVPESIFRGPKLATDPANWLGPITGYDGRVINISSSRSAGYSTGLRYNRSTAWGSFTFSSMGEKTLVRKERVLPNSLPTTSVNKRYVPMRMTTSLAWALGAWQAGVTNVYGGRYWTDTNNANIYPSRYTDDVMRWDANFGYDFGQRPGFGAKGEAWWRRALHDTRLRVTVINVANEEPPLTVNGAFNSSVIDPRLRRYILDFTKRF